jgi:hypothetical protein
MNARAISACRLSLALTTSISLGFLAGCGSSTPPTQGTESGSTEGETGASSTGAESGTGQQGSGTNNPTSGSVAPSGSSGTTTGGSGTGIGGTGAAGTGSGTGSSGTVSGTGSSGTATSGTGTTGTSGTGTSGSPGNGTAGPGAVTQVGGDVYHRGTYTAAGLSRTAVTTMAADTTFNMNATHPAAGNSQNQGVPSVLYVANGPAGAGCPAGVTGCTATTRAAGAGVFVAFGALGSTPNVFAYDETSGLTVWTAHVAAGGDGIRGTPAIDGTSRRILIPTGPGPHQVHAVSIDTGAEVTTGGWPVTVPFGSSNDGDQNQHGASFLLNNILYVPFGGHYGDGGNYRGVIFAVDITNPANTGSWTTASSRSGIWGAGGLASDGVSAVFTPTGNTSDGRANSDSEEMVRLTGLAAFTRSAANVFFPPEGGGWDGPDLDFSASTPAYVPLPGSTPSAILVAPAKAGRLYVLDATNLSEGAYNPATHSNMAGANNGGALADLVVSNTGGESVYTSPTIYTSESGLHATINVGQGDPNCPGGAIGNEVVVSVSLQPGKTPIAAPAWCVANKSGGGHMNYPPISTTTDGNNMNAIVWYFDGQTLHGVNGDNGMPIVTAMGQCASTIPSMSFPLALKNRIVVGTLGGVCSFSPGGT